MQNKENQSQDQPNHSVNKSHHSIITERSDFKRFKPASAAPTTSYNQKKNRSATKLNKNKLIMKLMKQIELH
jgi:hypothetical protein